uniref:Uncharacterized protein n=1 Tax=Globisporangium ultimum (strain ATCC 200006 / CBS 805.95 / DAOM BR144) TaxID=431595 RepID=K3WET9_GLOUD
MRREKDKWEERAREAMLECQQLQEQMLRLKHQNEELQSGEFYDSWFLGAQNGLSERQRVIDAVYKSRCTWEDVGDAVLEVLNNDLIWDAVEASARQEKDRVSRGLEALLVQLDEMDPLDGDLGARRRGEQQSDSVMASGSQSASIGRSVSLFHHRRSLNDPVRLIQCRACNGAGFIDPSDGEHGLASESYLRKTLAQVLELKTALDQANSRSDELECDLQVTKLRSKEVKEKLQQMEYIKSHGVDSCLQVDLDDEEGIDLDEIMRSASSISDVTSVTSLSGEYNGVNRSKKITSKRNAQYEHLIMELKSSLDEKDSTILELRKAHKELQSRLLAAQRASQKEQESHHQEVMTLKTSLTLALQHQNAAIEEKQATVKLLLKKFDKQQSRGRSLTSITTSVEEEDSEGGEAEEEEDGKVDSLGLDFVANLADEEFEKLDEVKRSEVVARRYSQAIERVQKEYEDQKSFLQQAEEEIGQDDERRKRTNSIALGNIVVSMTSHPRELFKALATTQNELLNVRRASQRSSTLQTDRLLTLTTHLSHLSEELCMVRKRTKTEIEFWKLECEKVQNANKVVVSDLQNMRLQMQTANERCTSTWDVDDGKCTLCEKHQARLMDISSQLLLKETQNALCEASDRSNADPYAYAETASKDVESTAAANQLTQTEWQYVSKMVLEIESLYATMTSSKVENVRKLIACAVLGEEIANNVDLRAQGSPIGRRVSPAGMDASRSSSSLLTRRTSRGPELSESARRKPSRLNSQQQLNPLREENQHQEDRDHAYRLSSDDVSAIVERGGSTQTLSPYYRKVSSTVFGTVQEDFLERTPTQRERVGDLAVSGISMGGSDSSFSPSHRKKTIVRKILTEDEVLRRRFTRTQRIHSDASTRSIVCLTSESQQVKDVVSDGELHSGDIAAEVADPCGDDLNSAEDDTPLYSSYVDPDGHQVYYEDIEVEGDDNGDGNEEQDALHEALYGSSSSNSYYRDNRVLFTERPRESQIAMLHVVVGNASVDSKSSELPLLDDWDTIERDPEVITQLRDVVKQSTATKQALAVTNWKILLYHLRAWRAQNRLHYINHVNKQQMNRRQHTPEHCLHAGLIHIVSTILINLSRKPTRSASARHDSSNNNTHYHHHGEVEPEQHDSSPRKSPLSYYSNRTLYPAALVDLSKIPTTQQIPTPHFPVDRERGVESPVRTRLTYRLALPEPRDSAVIVAQSPLMSLCSATAPSVFEDDNRFPQRAVKFVGPDNGYDFSLTHSLSSIARPAASPPTSGRRKPPTLHQGSHSAQPRKTLDASSVGPESAAPHADAFMDAAASARHVPVRPQSSPAGLAPRSTRARPHATGANA